MVKHPLPIPSSERERVVISWIARANVVERERLVERFFREEGETLEEATPRARSALRRLVAKGYLEQRPVLVAGGRADSSSNPLRRAEHRQLWCYSVTPRASASLGVPLLPPLRENSVVHHFKVLNAIETVERQQRAAGGRVLGFKLDGQLVREEFRGKVFNARTQQVVPKFADAQLTLRHADGSVEEVNLEYVSTKYTDQMIRDKAAAWRGSRTIWAAPNQATVARVEAITGQPAFTV
ncbi:hypothetical protein [Vitiosangium sp. GDMCC 1.1324]|uniref:hypothetical protein n=1 Tax=Vitiosangium sp. (strain GDMCC 1.1324) TaxID=2138576 RepID=UPI000D48CF58|nr:hypothetical protein [Vitiosangium sp. GDMCC 1.1324]PTL75448.1 hypothetical protein DAT35_55025 [Vitiosangium sp. GDMCC 1.1324]